jgi:hypothetical protein
VPFTARAFAYVFAGCETDPDCSSRYPGLEEMFYRTYEELARNPWTVAVDSSQFRRPAFTINAQDYIRAIYRLLGDREMMHVPAVVAAFHSREEDVIYQPCLNELITQFLDAPSRRPDDSCIAALPGRGISAELPERARGDR